MTPRPKKLIPADFSCQLQGDFLIRRVQADVAKEMISPCSGKNTVMQVNMGEGKTSVIIPICAAALANGNQLVRVVVPKALIPQTLDVLTDRLSGLVNKPVYHLTFSRDDTNIEVDNKNEALRKLKNDRGIVIAQPEHVLSLKLACVESLILQQWGFVNTLRVLTGSLLKLVSNVTITVVICTDCQPGKQPRTAEDSSSLPKLQRFLDTGARDIIDESDDVLRPQSQLIYAIGHQHPYEGSPDRWLIAQQVLGLVKRYTCSYSPSASPSYTIWRENNSPGSFPHIQILQAEDGEQLVSSIAEDLLDGRLSGLSIHSDSGLGGAIREFILCKGIHQDTVRKVEAYASQSASWSSLLLLRGLLAHGILQFALTQRRWRVDYGLDPSPQPRTMLAIPYRAKDVPSETAEFGHPDVAILLTCLSYYYGGLTEEQLRVSFELLLQQDDSASEYARWLQDCDTVSVPNALQSLSGVNIRSLGQWGTYLVPLFTRNKRAIDLYLSKVVFPRYAKEFPQRISGSSWDIAERKKVHLVTGQWVFHACIGSHIETRMSGFSGTNDAQYLLPTSIAQLKDDPDHLGQTGTNAKVLAYLLQPENSSYMVTADDNGERWTTFKLLKMVVAQKPQIRVLLDVGAQILDLSNLDVARAWLDCTPATEIAGAIYFSKNDKLMVLARNGTTQPLSSSPLAQQLHLCVAYLDDAHTRGTDIKFPLGFRAAVTLGQKVTKDRLVQGIAKLLFCD